MERTKITLLSLNLFLRPPLIKSNDGDYKDERCQYFIDHVMDQYDVIFLQEVFGFLNSRQNAIIDAALSKGFHVATCPYPSFWQVQLIDGGLLILSKFPILETSFMPFESGTFPDVLSHRGLLYAKLQVQTEILHAFTTHTQSQYLTKNNDLALSYRLIRREHIDRLSSYMQEKLQGSNDLVLLFGDMNVDACEGITEYEPIVDYEAMIELLCKLGRPLDLLKEKHGGTHPATFGRTPIGSEPEELVLTEPEARRTDTCLDYMFVWNLPLTKFSVCWEDTQVEPHFTKGKTFTQISDHSGVKTSLRLKSA